MALADETTTGASSPLDGLTAQLRELQAFVARSEAAGEEIPAEAVEMIARLGEIVRALDGLTASLDAGSTGQPSSSGPS